MLNKSEKILMSLISKQFKATLPPGNCRTLPNETVLYWLHSWQVVSGFLFALHEL